MATSEVEVESYVELKHLAFVRALAINAALVISNLYCYAKDNSGSFKPTVGKVENAVAAVVRPLFERFKGIPGDILVFLDKKADKASHKFNECAPPAAKNAVLKSQLIANNASRLVQELVEEAKVEGPLVAVSHAAKIAKDVAISGLAGAWYKANRYPTLHGVLEMAIPTAAYWSEKYNSLVRDLAGKGYSFFCYVPLVPVKEMEKAYKTDSGSSSQSDSDKD